MSLSRLWNRSGLQYFTPFYHTVSNNRLAHIWPLYQTVEVEEFVDHLDQLGKYFDFVSAQKFLELIPSKEKTTGKPKALLSFDDGLVECFTVIKPILQEKGVPAVFFINPGFVDTEDIFYRYKVALIIDKLQLGQTPDLKLNEIRSVLSASNKLKYTLEESLLSLNYFDTEVVNEILRLSGIKYRNSEIYMSSDQIMTLAEDGHSIGAHSMDHPDFDVLKNEDQLSQIKESLDYCQSHFNQSLRLFAFPFYDFNMPKSLFAAMFEKLKVDLSFGTSGLKKDVFERSIQRLSMEDFNSEVIPYVKNQLMYYSMKKIVGKHTLNRKV